MPQIETQVLSCSGTLLEGTKRDLFLLTETDNQEFRTRAMKRRDVGFVGCVNSKGRHQLYGYNDFERLPDEKRLYGIYQNFKTQIDGVLQEASDPENPSYSSPVSK